MNVAILTAAGLIAFGLVKLVRSPGPTRAAARTQASCYAFTGVGLLAAVFLIGMGAP